MTHKAVVTITPPTPNGDLHLGHLSGPFLSADICARTLKQNGWDVLLVSYTDDYQSYVPRKTDALFREPFEYARLIHKTMLNTMEMVDILPDCFMQPSDNDNFPDSVEHYLNLVIGEVFKEDRKTFYCHQCDVYGYEAYGRTECNWCGSSSDASQCENCARMPDIYQIEYMNCTVCGCPMDPVQILQYVWHIGQNYGKVASEHAGNPKRECLQNYLKESLSDDTEKWGITRPGDAGLKLKSLDFQPVHTWFMGMAGYRSAVKTFLDAYPSRGRFSEWWSQGTQLVHFLGYDCSYSHAIGYVAQQEKDKTGPTTGIFYTNRFLKLNGEDFSTSRGHAIWIKDLANQYPSDAIRLYTAQHAPETAVSNFQIEEFERWFAGFFKPLWLLVSTIGKDPLNDDLGEEISDRLDYEYEIWHKESGIGTFSAAGMANAFYRFSQIMITNAESIGFRHWHLWIKMANPLCPRIADKAQNTICKTAPRDLDQPVITQ